MPALAVTTGASLFSGILGSRAASGAARTQQQAAQQAAAASLQAGQNAAGAMNDATQAGLQSAQQGTDAGIQSILGGSDAANSTLGALIGRLGQSQSNYVGAGNDAVQQLQQYLAGPGSQQFGFDANQFRQTPGYEFALQQGQQAIERSAAARGAGPLSGGTLKALQRYTVNTADQLYGQAFDRARQTYQMNRENAITPLLGLAQLGQSAIQNVNAGDLAATGRMAGNQFDAGQMAGNARMNLGQFAAQFGQQGAAQAGRFLTGAQADANESLMGGANAMAAGRVGSANAWSNTIHNIGSNVAGSPQYRQGNASRRREVI